jgi:hypothetical protein
LAVCALPPGSLRGTLHRHLGSILTRDLYKRFLRPSASHDEQRSWADRLVRITLSP